VGWSGLLALVAPGSELFSSDLLVTVAVADPELAASPVSANAIPAAAPISRPVASPPAHAINRIAEHATT
jgi:hypothetical protein